jgi:transcription elongation GreA/GreB family factor
MAASTTDKSLLIEQLLLILNERKSTLENTLAATKESRDNDTKSSAGDKFETGRAMMQQEMDKLEQQLHQLQQQIHQLQAIDTHTAHRQVGIGSLVFTDTNTYFLAIAFGKLTLNDDHYWVVSTASPIGQCMLGKSIGDSFSFQGQAASKIVDLV